MSARPGSWRERAAAIISAPPRDPPARAPGARPGRDDDFIEIPPAHAGARGPERLGALTERLHPRAARLLQQRLRRFQRPIVVVAATRVGNHQRELAALPRRTAPHLAEQHWSRDGAIRHDQHPPNKHPPDPPVWPQLEPIPTDFRRPRSAKPERSFSCPYANPIGGAVRHLRGTGGPAADRGPLDIRLI